MSRLTWAYIALIVIGAAIGVFFILQKPRYIVTISGSASRDSIALYEQHVSALEARLDSTKASLARHGVLSGVAVRLRIAQMEEHVNALKEALRIWHDAHDQYGVGQAYRECLLLYGRAQSTCQALSYDTLPPESGAKSPPGR